MKSQALAVLLSPALFVLFAFAQQQPSSNATAQPPLQNVGTTCKEPLQPAASSDFWDGDEPNTANLVAHAFNRKRDVQKQIKPIQNCLADLSDAAAAHTSKIKELDERTQQGLQLASTKTDEADKHATDATNGANAALQAATQTTARVSKVEHVAGNAHQYKGNTQTEIQFRPGQSVLSKGAKEALDQMGLALKDQRNYIIEVRGYSLGHGQAAIADSQRMADSVVRYLVLNYQVPVHRIFVLGMGNAEPASKDATGVKRARTGRVEVSLLSNDVLSAEQR
jgi:outer membrane protein OmpA-like peptidoglycan-associated protein